MHYSFQDFLVPGNYHAHAYSAFRITLGYGIHYYHVLFDSEEGESGNVRLSVVHEFTIDFVGNQEQVVVANQVPDLEQFLRGIEI